MWHEARRQEKQLRARMVDGSKRAERRRKFYDSVRRDPDQFMQVHGSQCIIHTERSIARAAADANILRSWQGDPTIKIDRFDVRSHLETVDPVEGVHELTTMEEKEELICNFERYRLLIMNEFKDITEKAVLKNIADKEFWLTGQTEDQRKLELDKRRKTIDSKASIGFRYDDSETVAGKNEPGSSSEDEMQVEQLDADLEIYLNNPDSSKRCNKIGESFGIKDNHFCALFRADQQAQKTAAEIKRIDRQKAALVGRESKDDRRLLKQERAILIANARQDDALVSLSSFAKKEEKKPIIVESSSSSDDEPARAEYILSFGDDGNNKSKKHRKRKSNRNGRERRKSCSRDRRRRSSSSSGRRRRRSYSRRSRSRSRERRRSRDRRSRSRDRDRKRHRRSRSRSYDRKRRRDDSSSSRSRSPKKRSDKRMFVPKMAEAPKFQDPMESAQSSDDNGPIAVLEIRSSMSESEQERTEIENRKRRIRLTKKMVKSKAGEMARSQAEAEEKKNSEQVEAIKKKMKKALKATVDELKEEEEEKKREVERERRIRDESIRIEQEERRAREQKKIDEQRKADLGRAILNAKLLAEAQIAQKIREQQSEDGS